MFPYQSFSYLSYLTFLIIQKYQFETSFNFSLRYFLFSSLFFSFAWFNLALTTFLLWYYLEQEINCVVLICFFKSLICIFYNTSNCWLSYFFDNIQHIFGLLHSRANETHVFFVIFLVSVFCVVYVVIFERQKIIYSSYFLRRFLFSFFPLLDFIYLSKLKFFL